MAHRGRVAVTVFTRAPLRIDWAGGWTDVPRYADEHGGAVVNSAIARYAHAEFRLGDNRIRLHAEDLDEHVSLAVSRDIRYDGELDLHKAALNMFPVTGGIEILTRCDAPMGSGLGGSGALDVALVAGLARCRRQAFGAEELAELGFLLEASELGLAGGRQDQCAAAHGGTHHLAFGSAGVVSRRLMVSDEAHAELTRHSVLVYSGRSHFSARTHDRVWERFAKGDAAVTSALATMRELPEAAAGALEAGDWRELARVVDANWAQQQRLDVTIATDRTRALEQGARDAGAWGLKATGAGAGGCLVALVPPERRAAVVDAVEALDGTVLDVAFAAEGVEVRVEETEGAPDDS